VSKILFIFNYNNNLKDMATKTMNEYLEMDGSIAFNLAIYNRFSSIEDSCYSSICGGFIEGVYQWSSHNIIDINEVSNQKYIGWEIRFENDKIRKVYIEKWVMNSKPKDWNHAKNLFNKYLKVKACK
jgi:hypothetical protein